MIPDFGALVISLDFELHWGVRDHASTTGPYARNLLGVREAVPAMLSLFSEFELAATWATVGFLFARNRDELARFTPSVKPAYARPVLSPFEESVGEGEDVDPFHFAPSLISRIMRTPRQEIATHTFSHYYCLEAGQTREAFRADLASAKAIASEWGVQLHSIVFPRNQRNEAYDGLLAEAGIRCFRGTQPSWMYRPSADGPLTLPMRIGRAVDAYLPLSGDQCVPWSTVIESSGLANVRASHLMRAYSPRLRRLEPRRIGRLARGIRRAGRDRQIFHLWWHPHNFGTHLPENLAALRALLEVFSESRSRHGMRSLSMCEVAQFARS